MYALQAEIHCVPLDSYDHLMNRYDGTRNREKVRSNENNEANIYSCNAQNTNSIKFCVEEIAIEKLCL